MAGSEEKILVPDNRKKLVKAARYMAFLIGLRFLADYINVNTYYKR